MPAIQDGTLKFTIYQDPYLQGFLPVLYMYLYNLSGGVLAPPDTDTGLSVVTKSNVGPYIADSRWISPAVILFQEAETRAFAADGGRARLVRKGGGARHRRRACAAGAVAVTG